MREEYKVLAICLVTLTAFGGTMGMLASVTPTTQFSPMRSTINGTRWAGYSAVGGIGSVTDVKGTWFLPNYITGNNWFAYFESAFWVGIDGAQAGDHTVEQIGIECDVGLFNQPYLYAWYEMLGTDSNGNPTGPLVQISSSDFSVQLGMEVMAEVTYKGGGNFQLQLWGWGNTYQHYSTTQHYTGSYTPLLTSGEWIAEKDDYHSLTNFGSVSFSECRVNGAWFPSSGFQIQKNVLLQSLPNGALLASPTDPPNYSGGFAVIWYGYG